MDTNPNCTYLYGRRAHLWPAWPRRITLVRLFELLQLWHDRMAQRRQLAQLDDRMLKDIGITRADACRESGKWFWQD